MWIFIRFYQVKKQNILIQNNSDYKNMMNKLTLVLIKNLRHRVFLWLTFEYSLRRIKCAPRVTATSCTATLRCSETR